nr:hypothetical protein [Calothrix sp. MO_167.B12]
PECFARNKELVDWLESTPQPPSPQAWLQFREDQYRRWIDGNQTPPPIESIEDVDPRLRTPGLEQAMNKQKIEKMLAGYSPFDVLTGRAMVDVLNKIDPDNSCSLANSDDFLEDEDIYE